MIRFFKSIAMSLLVLSGSGARADGEEQRFILEVDEIIGPFDVGAATFHIITPGVDGGRVSHSEIYRGNRSSEFALQVIFSLDLNLLFDPEDDCFKIEGVEGFIFRNCIRFPNQELDVENWTVTRRIVNRCTYIGALGEELNAIMDEESMTMDKDTWDAFLFASEERFLLYGGAWHWWDIDRLNQAVPLAHRGGALNSQGLLSFPIQTDHAIPMRSTVDENNFIASALDWAVSEGVLRDWSGDEERYFCNFNHSPRRTAQRIFTLFESLLDVSPDFYAEQGIISVSDFFYDMLRGAIILAELDQKAEIDRSSEMFGRRGERSYRSPVAAYLDMCENYQSVRLDYVRACIAATVDLFFELPTRGGVGNIASPDLRFEIARVLLCDDVGLLNRVFSPVNPDNRRLREDIAEICEDIGMR